jgi:hypothetical protein
LPQVQRSGNGERPAPARLLPQGFGLGLRGKLNIVPHRARLVDLNVIAILSDPRGCDIV